MGYPIIKFSTYPQNPQGYPHSFPQHKLDPHSTYTQNKNRVYVVIDRRIQKTYTFPRAFLSTTALGTNVI